MSEVEVVVNGKSISLSEFPSDFIRNTVFGMLKPLKGIDEEIKDVVIIIKD